MTTLDVAEATPRFHELLARVENGETVQITRGGKAIVDMVAAPPEPEPAKPREKFDWDAMRERIAGMTPQTEPAEVFVRRMRDEGY